MTIEQESQLTEFIALQIIEDEERAEQVGKASEHIGALALLIPS